MNTFESRTEEVLRAHKEFSALENKRSEQALKLKQTVKTNILTDMRQAVTQMEALRKGNDSRSPVDISLAEYVGERWGFSGDNQTTLDNFYKALDIDPSRHAIHSLMTTGEIPDGYRFLMPEIIREAIRQGLRKPSVYSQLIKGEETVGQMQVAMPHINLSNGKMSKLGEGENIPVGNVSFGQKYVKLQKIGTGLKLTDEVVQYVALNLLSLYLQDVGVHMNNALDTLAVDTLINGDQSDNSESAPVIGVATAGTLVYRDLMQILIRMNRLGRSPQAMLSDETMFLDIYNLDEFKAIGAREPLDTRLSGITPMPASLAYLVHGAMPDTNQVMFVDRTSALIKLNAQALTVETDRIAERQMQGTYITQTTGFASMFRDARVILDKSLAFASNGFPTWMDVSAFENSLFRN